jgi:hypothetical protein
LILDLGLLMAAGGEGFTGGDGTTLVLCPYSIMLARCYERASTQSPCIATMAQ